MQTCFCKSLRYRKEPITLFAPFSRGNLLFALIGNMGSRHIIHESISINASITTGNELLIETKQSVFFYMQILTNCPCNRLFCIIVTNYFNQFFCMFFFCRLFLCFYLAEAPFHEPVLYSTMTCKKTSVSVIR